jgi:hypothetical protein
MNLTPTGLAHRRRFLTSMTGFFVVCLAATLGSILMTGGSSNRAPDSAPVVTPQVPADQLQRHRRRVVSGSRR